METKTVLNETNALGLLQFIGRCPTCFQAVDALKKDLTEQGYTELREQDAWNVLCGGRYFVTRNDSSLLAFRVPEKVSDTTGFCIVATHDDSPAFKLKANFEQVVPDAYTKLNVEKYGGMICSSWMDRPLSVAGRVVIATENGVESRLFDMKKDAALIPNVAIHMNRNINEGMNYNPQVDMLPLVGSGKSTDGFKNQLLREIGVEESALLAHDLFVYNNAPGSVWGPENEFISAPRLDDLMCVYAALRGFLAVDAPRAIPVLAVFDNEEVGSNTRQGAASSFLEDTLERIQVSLDGANGFGLGLNRRLVNSFMLSSDNAHAVHPNHPEYADAQNRPTMNGGVVVKYHANQQYATDAVSAAIFKQITNAAGVRTQTFANRSDLRGGSTLGNIATTRVPLLTVDIGMAQLAMHSAYETAGCGDLSDMIRICETFYQSEITCEGNGKYRISCG